MHMQHIQNSLACLLGFDHIKHTQFVCAQILYDFIQSVRLDWLHMRACSARCGAAVCGFHCGWSIAQGALAASLCHVNIARFAHLATLCLSLSWRSASSSRDAMPVFAPGHLEVCYLCLSLSLSCSTAVNMYMSLECRCTSSCHRTKEEVVLMRVRAHDRFAHGLWHSRHRRLARRLSVFVQCFTRSGKHTHTHTDRRHACAHTRTITRYYGVRTRSPVAIVCNCVCVCVCASDCVRVRDAAECARL